MKRYLILVILLAAIGYSSRTSAQVSIEQKESDVLDCLDGKVGTDSWKWLVDYFESYLVSGEFGDKEHIQSAYTKYIEYRTGYPSKKMPALPNRAELKQKLIDWKIISAEKTFSSLFLECYYQANKDFGTYPKSTLKDVASIGEVLSKIDLSSGILMGGLGESLKEKDFQKEIYRRSVILLSLGEVLYIEELIKNEAGEDNPIYRSLKKRAEEQPVDAGLVKENDPRLERKPEPEGGLDNYLQWINDSNSMKARSKKPGKNDRVVVQGVINKEGNLVDLGVLRGIGMGYDEEAVRLVRTHPVRKWKTGTIGGKPVDVTVEIAVSFRNK